MAASTYSMMSAVTSGSIGAAQHPSPSDATSWAIRYARRSPVSKEMDAALSLASSVGISSDAPAVAACTKDGVIATHVEVHRRGGSADRCARTMAAHEAVREKQSRPGAHHNAGLDRLPCIVLTCRQPPNERV